MNENVLDRDKKRIIGLQLPVLQKHDFFMAGGTGLALRLGHRVSQDLDWFTAHEFDARSLAASLSALPEKPTSTKPQGPNTLRAYYGSLETSFIRYAQVEARPETIVVGALRVPVADLETLALMKAAAVHDRGTKRDFIDIHAICSAPGWSLTRFIDLATNRLPLQPSQMRLALTYFKDADVQPMPQGCHVTWEQVKADLQRAIKSWERERPSRRER